MMTFSNAISFIAIVGTTATAAAANNINLRHLQNLDDHDLADTICGDTDDRVQSFDPRMGRLFLGGSFCTAWLISNDVFLTAGHCVEDRENTPFTVSFNVPLSNGNGNTNPSAPQDVYEVRFDRDGGGQGELPVEGDDWRHNSPGDDWAIGRLLPNAVTNQLPGVAQSCYFNIEFEDPTDGLATTIRGYGSIDNSVDDPLPRELNLVQTTHTGELVLSAGGQVRYVTDTRSGQSGAPVINANTDSPFGIHNDGGCGSSSGSNAGTSVNNEDLKAAMARYLGLVNAEDQVPSGACAVDGSSTTTSTTTTSTTTSTATTTTTPASTTVTTGSTSTATGSTSTTGTGSTSTTTGTTQSTSTSTSTTGATTTTTSAATTTSTTSLSTTTTMPTTTSKASKSVVAKASKAKASKATTGTKATKTPPLSKAAKSAADGQ